MPKKIANNKIKIKCGNIALCLGADTRSDEVYERWPSQVFEKKKYYALK